ncbi:MAG: hypothetical protein H7Y14_03500, partial [Burkholderiales bacterium]|nr:hypothetical protein [Burkholderiales bacterium]
MTTMTLAPIAIHAAPPRRCATAPSLRAKLDGDAAPSRTSCSACNLRELCLPRGLEGEQMAAFSENAFTRRRVKRGNTLYRSGEAFSAVYAVCAGFFK